jgi:hypothetical protein
MHSAYVSKAYASRSARKKSSLIVARTSEALAAAKRRGVKLSTGHDGAACSYRRRDQGVVSLLKSRFGRGIGLPMETLADEFGSVEYSAGRCCDCIRVTQL